MVRTLAVVAGAVPIPERVERRARWGFSYLTIANRADMEPFAPVIARLAGR